jgi:hypothetical protein
MVRPLGGHRHPQAIVDCVAAVNDPEIADRIRAAGTEPAPLGPAAKAFIDDEIRKWAVIVKSSGAQV